MGGLWGGLQGTVGAVGLWAWLRGVACRAQSLKGVACGCGMQGIARWGRGLWAWACPCGLLSELSACALWKAGPHQPGRPGCGEGDAPASPGHGPARWMLCREIYCSGHIWVLFLTDRRHCAWGAFEGAGILKLLQGWPVTVGPAFNWSRHV